MNSHIGKTYRFDAFSNGWVEVLAAEQTNQSVDWYQGTADAIRQQLHQFTKPWVKNVLILSGDHLYRMDYGKLIERHPHVYGDVIANDEETVKANWEKIKLKTGNKSVLEGVPTSLPALVKAIRIQDKARGVGFDWERKEQVWEKVEEEMHKFKKEFNVANEQEIDRQRAMAEFGDLLFSLVNYSRFIGIDPEEALERTNKKFIKRFQFLETESKKDGKQLGEMTLAEMDVYWEKAKALRD